eukprot:1023680-Lingulodinium_polyedra.AAC.1
MGRRRSGGGSGGQDAGRGGRGGQGGRSGGNSRSPSSQQLSATERKMEAFFQKYTSKFANLATKVEGIVGTGTRDPDW